MENYHKKKGILGWLNLVYMVRVGCVGLKDYFDPIQKFGLVELVTQPNLTLYF